MTTKGVRIGVSFPMANFKFSVANVLASQDGTAVPADANGDTVVMPFDGYIVAMTGRLNAALSAGTVTVKSTVGGTEDATNTLGFSSTAQSDTVDDGQNGLASFSAGDALGVVYDSDASVSAETTDLVVEVFVIFDDAGEF